MTNARKSKSRERVSGARAWMNAPTGYPVVWSVSLPTRYDSRDTLAVESLQEAIDEAARSNQSLEIDAHLYQYMVDMDFAPAAPPSGVSIAEAGNERLDEQREVHERAAGLVGMTAQSADDIATQRGLYVRVIRPGDAVTADYCATRVNLGIDETDHVRSVYLG
ncbi:I78 family peptidase inhibitor [Allobranchiibius sp. CTAmp26]|uniref:I78 family peptidase inhibitor n=1 Tax=Allobranchiibius sp. CTAmp26 TaxID=2815214 RepID=UPI001AA14673|nr:I78 family peptidase inhibitor [Allobranchiibius sp. CTAmp26]MBO1755544.1 hypothetical protein [Allobranchiibius sp. CTAmp26]